MGGARLATNRSVTAAKTLATRAGRPAGQFVSDLLREALHARAGTAGTTAVQSRERYGFRPIPAGGAVVTDDLVNEIRDGLGV